jgi:hypothetical protein
MRIFEIGDKFALRIQNNSNETINILIIDLQPDWGTTTIHSPNLIENKNFLTMTQHSTIVIPLRADLPSEYNEGKDIIKIFFMIEGNYSNYHPLLKLISHLSTNKPITKDIVENVRSNKDWMSSRIDIKIIRKQ